MPITALPTPPTRNDPANFSARADAFLAALPTFVTQANALESSLTASATTGTSTSSVLMGTGSKTFTTQSGKAWAVGAWVYLINSATPTNFMVGQITAYSSTTLTVNVSVVSGSGTFATWAIGLAVPAVAAADLAGGVAGAIPFQSAADQTAFSAAGTAGQVLLSGGAGAPTWASPEAMLPKAVAAGTGDAITATFTPAITALTANLLIYVRAAAANTTQTPTLAVNGLAAKTIVKGSNMPLTIGDIDGAGHWLLLAYDATLGKFVLLNPAYGVVSQQPGEVCFFARNTPPAGFIKANGAAVSRTTYADLFAAIGTTWGAGDGTTTFNVPDMRGEFPRGWDDARGADSGRAFGSGQSPYAGSFTVSASADDGDGQTGSFRAVTSMDFNGQVSITGGAGSGTVTVTPGDSRPRNVALLACIKY